MGGVQTGYPVYILFGQPLAGQVENLPADTEDLLEPGERDCGAGPDPELADDPPPADDLFVGVVGGPVGGRGMRAQIWSRSVARLPLTVIA